MTISVFYRCAVWLPLLVPAAVAAIVHGLGLQPTIPVMKKLVQILLISGVYGGLPYALLAAYATWWIDHRPESQIRKRALVAPFWMIGAWVLFVFVLAIRSGNSEMVLGLLALGTAMIIPIGYAYVCLVLMTRRLLRIDPPSVDYEAAT